MTPLKLWHVDGPFYTAIVAAESAETALSLSAHPGEGEPVGWAEMGLDRDTINVEPLEGGDEPRILVCHTG